MNLKDTLELIINVDTGAAIGKLEGFASKTQTEAEKATESLQKFHDAGKKLMTAGVGGMGVGGMLTQLASGDIEATNQLKAAVGQVGQSYEEYAKRIEETAAAQVRFGHTDEQVTGALTTLTVAYNDTGKALDQMQLVADIAARKQISLGDAAAMVAKAHGGASRIFREFGVQVGYNAAGAKDFDGALGELSKKLTGQAAASADTFNGKLKAIRAEVENVVSQFGQKFGPAILAGSTVVTALGGTISAVTAIQARHAAATEAATLAAERQAAANGALAASEGGVGVGAFAGAAGLGVLGLAVATAGLAFYTAKQFFDDWNGAGISAVEAIEKAVERLAKPNNLMSFKNQVADTIGALAENGNGIRGFDDAAKQLFDKTLAKNGPEAASKLLTAINQLKADGIVPATTDVDAMSTALATVARSTDGYATSLDELNKKLKAQTDPFFAVIHGYEQVAAAQDRVRTAQDAYNAAVAKYGAWTKEAAAAQAALNTATVGAATAASGFDAALRTLESSVLSGKTSVQEAQSALQRWVNEGALTQEQANSVAASFSNVAQQAAMINGLGINIYFNQTDIDQTLAKLALIKGGMGDSAVIGPGLNYTPDGYVPRFANGGIVPGPRDAPQLAIVHGGERVVSNREQDTLAAASGGSVLGTGAGINIGSMQFFTQEPMSTGRAVADELTRLAYMSATG